MYDSHSNSIPRGLAGGFFVYNALGDMEIYFADQNVIDLFECDTIEEFREHVGNSFKGMVYPPDFDRIQSNIEAQTFHTGKRHDYVRYRIKTKKGNIRYIEDFGHLLHGENDLAVFYVYIVDVEKEEYFNHVMNSFAEEQIYAMNNRIDRLTGLMNMTAFYDEVQEHLQAGGEVKTVVVVYDILGLREVNRLFGRDEGDARIRSLADAIVSHMPSSIRIFRGYEAELIVVCRNCEEKDILPCVLRVIHACKSDVMYGTGSVCNGYENPNSASGSGTLLQALEEAQYALRVKKMLSSNSEHSQALTSLVRALKETDPDTEEHVQRTQKMGELLGRRIGLTDSQLTSLRLLCLLHDIGKITVPLEILNKPGKLTDAEWAVLRLHAEKGYQIALTSDELKPIAAMILNHHERWDGKGYPNGLISEEIPILSRVIAIVDAYDAMVNDRSYRKALPPEEAQREIRDNAGTQFDPIIAEEFLVLLEEVPGLAHGTKTGAVELPIFQQTLFTEIRSGNTSPVIYTRYILDGLDQIIEVDENFEKLTGYSGDDVIGKMSQNDLIPEQDMEQYLMQVQAQFSQGNIAYLKHYIQCKDGSIKQVISKGERRYESSVRAVRSTLFVVEV